MNFLPDSLGNLGYRRPQGEGPVQQVGLKEPFFWAAVVKANRFILSELTNVKPSVNSFFHDNFSLTTSITKNNQVTSLIPYITLHFICY